MVCVIPHSASIQRVGDIGMVGVEIQTLEFFVALPQTLCQNNYLHDRTSLFSLPWLHKFTIIGIWHDNWRIVAIPRFFIRTWERSSVPEECRSSQHIQGRRKRLTLENVSRAWLKLYYTHDYWPNYYNSFLAVNSNTPSLKQTSSTFSPSTISTPLCPWSGFTSMVHTSSEETSP